MRLAIRHVTHYDFAQPAVYGLQRLRLMPKPTHGQTVLAWDMKLDGAHCEAEYDDQHHNHTALVSAEPGTKSITIDCTGLVDTADHAGILGEHSGHMPLWAFLAQTTLTQPGAAIRAMIAPFEPNPANPLDVLHVLSGAVVDAVRYEIGRTDSATTAEQAMTKGAGVCQDHAHIFIGAARALGIPARYVSGYLLMDDRVEQDAGHAWAEAHVADLGWVAFDISNGISPDERYVRVASGCDYREAAPVTGISYGAVDSELSVRLAVRQQTSEQ